jgi:outer membrane protein insertion porin family
MSGRFVAPAIAVIGSVGVALYASPVRAQDGQPIGQVEIRGIVRTNVAIVKNALAAAGIKEGQVYHRESINDARQKVLDEGYYSDVYIKAELSGDKKANITAEVIENPLIKYVAIRGNTKIPATKILPRLSSKPDTVLNTRTLREDARTIQKIYQQAGYEAFLTEIGDIFDTKTGALTFPVSETIVDSIEIQGLKKTKPYVILREMHTKVGDVLNYKTLRADINRIYNTQLLEDVETPSTVPTEEGHVKLVIPVKEKRTGQVQVGFGYSVQQRLTGTLQIQEQNFQGKGQSVSASWTVGGTVAKNQYDLGFGEPWLDKYNTSLSVDLYTRINFRFNRILSSSVTNGTSSNPYYEERKGASLTLGRPTGEFSKAFLTFRTEGIQANNLQPAYDLLTIDELTNIRGALVEHGNVSSVTVSHRLNTRDNEQNPSEGLYFSPSLELGSAVFSTQKPSLNPDYISSMVTPEIDRILVSSGDQRGGFTKAGIDLREYFNLSGTRRVTPGEAKPVLATRLLLGSAAGNIAFAEQYFVGGADTLRGYQDDRFWGNNLFLTSVEWRIPMEKRGDLTFVTFLDYGDAWGSTSINREDIPGFGQHEGFGPRLGGGFGIRLKTPVGPVRLDLGKGETLRTHFSIGQAF